jgi:A/G-specific adenine glycosylase
VSRFCKASAPERLPVKRGKVSITAVDEHALWLRDGAGRLLMHHESGKRRTGLWKLPVRELSEMKHLPLLTEQRYAITRYRVTLRVYSGNTTESACQLTNGDAWVDPDEVPVLAMAAPFRRVVEELLADF